MSVVRREIFLSYGREPEVRVVLRMKTTKLTCSVMQCGSLPVSHLGKRSALWLVRSGLREVVYNHWTGLVD